MAMMAEHDIEWASGDIPGDMFFTRAEFEEFSCQHNLYERLVDKEKELHPNRPALFTVKREQDVPPPEGNAPKTELLKTEVLKTEVPKTEVPKTEPTVQAQTRTIPIKREPPSAQVRTPPQPATLSAGGGKDKKQVLKAPQKDLQGIKSEKPPKAKKQNMVWAMEVAGEGENGDEEELDARSESSEASSKIGKGNKVWVMPGNDTEEPVVPYAAPSKPLQRRSVPHSYHLTAADHRLYLQLQKKYGKGPQRAKPTGPPNELQKFKELHQKVVCEQEEFLAFTKAEAAAHPEKYQHLHPDIQHFMEDYIGILSQRVANYPQFYVQCGIASLTEVKCVPMMHFKCLLQMGEVPRAVMPNVETMSRPRLPVEYERITERFPITQDPDRRPTSSFDDNAEKLANKYAAEVVISASGLKCLLDQGANLERQWELPVVVKEHTIEDTRGRRTQKVVYIDKPFPPRTMLTTQKNAWFQKFALKTQVQHRNHQMRHIFSHSSLQTKPEKQVAENMECDLDSLETFGVSESRLSAFKKYVRPGGVESSASKADDEMSDGSSVEETKSTEGETGGSSNGKGIAFSRSGSEGFIVGNPEVVETIIKTSEAASAHPVGVSESKKEGNEKSDPSISKNAETTKDQPKKLVDQLNPSTIRMDVEMQETKEPYNEENQVKESTNISSLEMSGEVVKELKSKSNEQSLVKQDETAVVDDKPKEVKLKKFRPTVRSQPPSKVQEVELEENPKEGKNESQVEHSSVKERTTTTDPPTEQEKHVQMEQRTCESTSEDKEQTSSSKDNSYTKLRNKESMTVKVGEGRDIQDSSRSMKDAQSISKEQVKVSKPPAFYKSDTQSDSESDGLTIDLPEDKTRDESQDKTDASETEKTMEITETAVVAVKRGRGRPKKSGKVTLRKEKVVDEPEETTSATEEIEKTKRVPKESQKSDNSSPEDNVETEDTLEVTETEAVQIQTVHSRHSTGLLRDKNVVEESTEDVVTLRHGQGQLRKSDMSASQEEEVSDEIDQVKHGKGRPRKINKKTPKQEVEVDDNKDIAQTLTDEVKHEIEDDDKDIAQTLTDEVKHEIEDDDLIQTEIHEVKRGRGRPRKLNKKTPKKVIREVDDNEDVAQTPTGEVKRGRGRPRKSDKKTPKKEVSSEVDDNEEIAQIPKDEVQLGRGRRRKSNMSTPKEEEVSDEIEENNEVSETDAAKVKRGQGRQRKSDMRAPKKEEVSDEIQDEDVIQTEVDEVKLGRGRRRKSNRNTSIKVEVSDEIEDDAVTQTEAPRVKRGRSTSCKSDKSTPHEEEVSDNEDEESDDVVQTEAPKAKGGRPRKIKKGNPNSKIATEIVQGKRGRGRPPKERAATVTLPITLEEEPPTKRINQRTATALGDRKRHSLASAPRETSSEGEPPSHVKRTRRTRSATLELQSTDDQTTSTPQAKSTEDPAPQPCQSPQEDNPQPMLTEDSPSSPNQPTTPDPSTSNLAISEQADTPTPPAPPAELEADPTPPIYDDPDDVPKQVGGGPERPRKLSTNQMGMKVKVEPGIVKKEPGTQPGPSTQKSGPDSRTKLLSTLDKILQAQEHFLKTPSEEARPGPESHQEMQSSSTRTAPPAVKQDPGEWKPSEPASDYTTYDQDNLTYNLWLLGNIRIIVRCGIHGTVRNKKKSHFVSLSTKLEQQCVYGLEQVTPSETVRSWVDLHIRHVDKVARVRVNAYNSEVMAIDQLTIGNIVNAQTGFNPMVPLGRLHGVLDSLKKLSAGHYLLSHTPGNQHATIKRSVTKSSGAYDLHKAYLDGEVGATRDDWIPWVPIDPAVPLFHHKKQERIPATFLPKDPSQKYGKKKKGKKKKGKWNN